jgi:hypothetical protein
MSKKFQDCNFIFYVCIDQDEITALQRLNINNINISKKRFHDDYYEMHLIESIKNKVTIITFNNLRLETFNEVNQQPNNIILFRFPKQYKKLINHLIKNRILENVKSRNRFYPFYEKRVLIKYLLLRYSFSLRYYKS